MKWKKLRATKLYNKIIITSFFRQRPPMAFPMSLNILGKQCVFPRSPWPSMQPNLRATRSPSHFPLGTSLLLFSLKRQMWEKKREIRGIEKDTPVRRRILKFVALFKPLASEFAGHLKKKKGRLHTSLKIILYIDKNFSIDYKKTYIYIYMF